MARSNDIERSKRFYDAVLATLGAGEPLRNIAGRGHVRYFYRHDGSTSCISEPINDEPAANANGGTIGFKCNSPEHVQRSAGDVRGTSFFYRYGPVIESRDVSPNHPGPF